MHPRLVWPIFFGALLAGCKADSETGEGSSTTTTTTTTPSTTVEPLYAMSDGTLTGCNDIEIAWQRFDYTGGEASATYLFINGRTEYTDKYHHVLDLIGERDIDVVMFDHYGQGRSGGIRAHSPGYDNQFVCDLSLVVEQLVDKDKPLVVTGHSMGGAITTRWAALNPNVADAIVLSSPMLKIDTGDYTYQEAFGLVAAMVATGAAEEPFEEDSPRADCEHNVVTHDCELYDQFKDDPLTMIGPPTWGWLYEGFVTTDTIRAEAASFPQPIAIYQAGEEQVVDNDGQTEFCDALNSAHPGWCELTTWQGDYHELFMELDRQDIMTAALAYFDAQLGQ